MRTWKQQHFASRAGRSPRSPGISAEAERRCASTWTEGAQPARTSSSQPLRRLLPIHHRAPHHPDVPRQLRRSRQLPSHLRWHVGRVGRRHARPSTGGERVAPAVRDGAPRGARFREQPDCRHSRLAGHGTGPCRGCRRRAARDRDRRGVWNAFANNLGAVPVYVVQPWLLTTIVLGILSAANLLAVAPALAARRSRPQQLLRGQ